MPTTKLMACAGSVLIDQSTNSLSMIEVIDMVEAPSFPIAIPRFVIVWVKARDSHDGEKADYVLEVQLPGAEKRVYPMHVDFQGVQLHRSIATLVGLPIQGPGEIEIRVTQEGKSKAVASLSIPVLKAEPSRTVKEPIPASTARKKALIARKRATGTP